VIFPGTEYAVELLNDAHDRAGFECGVPGLDRYLRQQAGQDSRKRVAAVYLLVKREGGDIAGFYTLANTALHAAVLPAEWVKKLPRYPLLPATLLGRLAVELRHRQRGLGEFLLLDALRRSLELSRASASFAVVVDAKDPQAAGFYRRYGFETFIGIPNRLFLTLRDIESSLGRSAETT
jgi:GNAT superfamily N-acetyltransferase